jgi:DNA-binding NtrC family response regulator
MPFVVCNCSAVVETLFESELFGHVKGAFTGATSDKIGLFEYAHGGMLFLDEIGDMPLSTQAKLLRVLQNREVQRVGSLTSSRTVDVRVVAATNHDLRERIQLKQFREDLFYRLSMVEIQTPRLAERPEDLPLLERYFMQQFAVQYHKPVRGITQRAQIVLARYSWPGNVRELQNVIGHACMMAAGDKIDIHDLPDYLRSPAPAPPAPKPAEAQPAANLGGAPGDGVSLDERERRLLANALEKTSGNQAQAARLLGITRDRLRYKMKKFQLV